MSFLTFLRVQCSYTGLALISAIALVKGLLKSKVKYKNYMVSKYMVFQAVFLQSFRTVVPNSSYSSLFTSGIFYLSSQKIFAKTHREEKWQEGFSPTSMEKDSLKRMFSLKSLVAAVSDLEHTEITSQISIFIKICTHYLFENLPWFQIGLLISKEQKTRNLEECSPGWSNLEPNKLDSQFSSPHTHFLLSQSHHPPKRASVNG